MNNIGKRLMPIYLIKFLEENYFDIIPENFGRIMVSRQFIAEIKALYDEFDGKPIDNYGRRMVPEYLIKAFSDIEYIEYTDDDVKYEKTVPTGALKYATLDMLGGMSYKCNNLWDEDFELGTIDITTGDNIPSSATCRCKNYQSVTPNTTYILNYVYRVFYYDSSKTYLSYAALTDTTGNGKTFTTPNDCYFIRFNFVGEYGTTYKNDIRLNEGSTLLPYEPHFSGIRDSSVTSIVAKKTYEIDEHIQAITGYGYGINDTLYNYIDYENKKFIQKVDKYIVNNDTEITEQIIDSGNGIGARIMIPNNVLHGSSPITSLSLDKITYSAYYSNNGIGYSVHNANDTNIIYIRLGEDYDTVEKVKTYLVNNNATFYYELATPVETDISDYIKDNFIEVEPTGSVTFTNEYEQAVPSEVTYLIKE